VNDPLRSHEPLPFLMYGIALDTGFRKVY
jgi:hypothetical protein